MPYDEESLMETFAKWDSKSKRERFLRRKQHELNAKERRFR